MVWSLCSVLRLFMANLVEEALYVSRMVRPASESGINWQALPFHFHFSFC